jgi:hypothetical protein
MHFSRKPRSPRTVAELWIAERRVAKSVASNGGQSEEKDTRSNRTECLDAQSKCEAIRGVLFACRFTLSASDIIDSELAARHLVSFSSDTVADDWHPRISSKRIITLALSRLESRGKGILLLHDIHKARYSSLCKSSANKCLLTTAYSHTELSEE